MLFSECECESLVPTTFSSSIAAEVCDSTGSGPVNAAHYIKGFSFDPSPPNGDALLANYPASSQWVTSVGGTALRDDTEAQVFICFII